MKPTACAPIASQHVRRDERDARRDARRSDRAGARAPTDAMRAGACRSPAASTDSDAVDACSIDDAAVRTRRSGSSIASVPFDRIQRGRGASVRERGGRIGERREVSGRRRRSRCAIGRVEREGERGHRVVERMRGDASAKSSRGHASGDIISAREPRVLELLRAPQLRQHGALTAAASSLGERASTRMHVEQRAMRRITSGVDGPANGGSAVMAAHRSAASAGPCMSRSRARRQKKRGYTCA